MKRSTAKLLVDSIARMVESLGVVFDDAMTTPGMQLSLRMMPKSISKLFKYGTDRESIIKYLTMHAWEPSAGERRSWPVVIEQLPQLLGQALLTSRLTEVPRKRNYRTKIDRSDRADVCRKVAERERKGKTYAQAIREVAEIYGVHSRTIRRHCPRRGAAA